MATHALTNDVYLKVAEFLREGRKFALAVVMKDAGSTPRKAGTKAIIDEEGCIWGTIGGGLLENDARKMGLEAIRSGRLSIFDFKFTGSCAAENDPVCGGNMRILIDPTAVESKSRYLDIASAIQQRRRGIAFRTVHDSFTTVFLLPPRYEFNIASVESAFARVAAGGDSEYVRHEDPQTGVDELLIEPIIPAPLLLISGGGHVGQALAKQAALVGFDVVVVEDREEFADPSLFPPGVKTRRAQFEDAMKEFPVDADTYIALVGRGHIVDSKALLSCLNSPAAYIGMMGSRRKVALVKKHFIDEKLIDEEGWKKIHAPIGLDIGAETVPEIAASIVAQLVAVRRKKDNA